MTHTETVMESALHLAGVRSARKKLFLLVLTAIKEARYDQSRALNAVAGIIEDLPPRERYAHILAAMAIVVPEIARLNRENQPAIQAVLGKDYVPPRPIKATHQPPRLSNEVLQATRERNAMSILDTRIIRGRKLGDIKHGEIDTFRTANERDNALLEAIKNSVANARPEQLIRETHSERGIAKLLKE